MDDKRFAQKKDFLLRAEVSYQNKTPILTRQ